MKNKKRLNPLYIFEKFFKNYRLLIVFIFATKDVDSKFQFFLISVIFLVLNFSYQLLKYLNISYTLDKDTLVYNRGIFKKESKLIKFSNIQNIDTSANFYYQIFSLISLDINIMNETVKLSPIKKSEANRLISLINNSEIKNNPVEKSKENILLRLNTKDLILLGLLKSRIIATFFLIAAFLDDILDFFKNIFNINGEKYLYSKSINYFSGTMSAMLFIFLLFLILFIISFVSAIIKFQGFKLENKGDKLIVKYGFFNKNALVIKKERIQKIHIEKNLKYRLLGLSSLSIVTTSSNVIDDIASGKHAIDIIPIAKEKFVLNFLKNILKLDIEEYEKENYEKIPEIGQKIILRWWLIFILILFIILNISCYFITLNYKNNKIIHYLCFNLVILLLFILFFSMYKFNMKHIKIALSKDMIIKKGTLFFTEKIDYLKPIKVGSVSIKTNIFLKKGNLCHITLDSIGRASDISLRYFDRSYIEKIVNYLAIKGDKLDE